ncbi:MAG: mandelate racemase/muconate lactonizing enzyme family protein [Bryobacteraceae bacterium]
MTISTAEAAHYRIPLPQVLSDSIHGDMPDFELVTAQVRTSDGLEGLGYTYTVGRGGSAIRAMIADDLAPLLRGGDPRRVEQLWNRMWWGIHWVGRGGVASFAMAAIDVALWDLKAKAAGEPLWRLLGGATNRVKAYAGGIDLQFTLDELRAQTEGFLRAGFQAIKVKVGRERLAEDVERIRAVREVVGSSFTLMADANCRWRVDQAIRAARALEPFDLTWLEEPTNPDDVEGFARIATEGGVPLAAGENLHTVSEFERLLRDGRVAFPEPDLTNLGGITPWLHVAKIAQARHLPVTSHGVHDLHVHLLAAVPNASYLEVHGFGLERFLSEPLPFERGEAIAPDRPGHGVDLQAEALRPFRVS